MNVKKRSVGAVLCLSIFTCGIYYIYLIYKLGEELNEVSCSNSNNGVVDVLLTFLLADYMESTGIIRLPDRLKIWNIIWECGLVQYLLSV